MRGVKVNGEIKIIHLNMKVIQTYLSLGHAEVAADEDLALVLGLPHTPEIVKVLKEEIAQEYSSLDTIKLKEMCAEMGLAAQYYEMSPRDIELAYAGHSRIICNLGNLLLVVNKRIKKESSEPISIEPYFSREETLRRLGLEEKYE